MPGPSVERPPLQPYRPAGGAVPSAGAGPIRDRRPGRAAAVPGPGGRGTGRHAGGRGRRTTPAVLAALVGLLAGGCGFTQSPRAEIGGAALVDRSAEALRFDVTARLENPNREDSLELRTVEYTVRLEDVGTFRGLRAAQVTLAPRSASELRLPVVVPAERLPADLDTVRWTMNARLLYIAPGALAETLLDAGVRRPTLRFSGRGSVALDGDPVTPRAFPDVAGD